jgi:glycosyltransferase involved in cell wall biosynthesis
MSELALTNKPKVSVIMSCYNASRWLHEAIDSVLGQTFSNFEFIIVDDGSSDDTWNIIQNYCDKDQRIVAITKKNTGQGDSRNMAIAIARGDWIAVLDADDLCEPTRLEKQFSFIRNNPEVVLLGSGFVEIDEHGKFIKRHIYPVESKKLVSHLERLKGFFPHSSAFFRADFGREVGLYNSRIRRAEDWRLMLALSSHGQVACLPETLVQIRKHANQTSRDESGQRQIYDAVAATACYFLLKNGYTDPSVSTSSEEWMTFLSWIENRVDEADVFEKNRAWSDARTKYYSFRNRLIGTIHFGSSLFQSRHALSLIKEKLFGSYLPERLAREWIKHSNQTIP